MLNKCIIPMRRYNALLACCTAQGSWRDALQLYRMMRSTPGLEPDEISYSSLLDVMAR